MSLTEALIFDPHPHHLSVRVQSRYMLDHKSECIQAIATALRTGKRDAMLLDCREVPGSLTFMDRFQLGLLAGRYLAGVRVCVLARPDQADPQKIGQLVARNRGTDVTTVTDAAAAEAWVATLSPPA